MCRAYACGASLCCLCARIDKGTLSHFDPLFLLSADDISAPTQHLIAFSHAVIFDYSVVPAVEELAFADFPVLK